MPLELQAKLLRVLEEGEVRRRRREPADRGRRAHHRRDPPRPRASSWRENEFREDLYYRLNVHRRATAAAARAARGHPAAGRALRRASARASRRPRWSACSRPKRSRLLASHDWPGNVRELENVVESAVVTGISATVGPKELEDSFAVIAKHPLDRAKRDLISLRELEQEYINWVLERSGGNRTRAAEILGIDPSTLYRREVRGKG